MKPKSALIALCSLLCLVIVWGMIAKRQPTPAPASTTPTAPPQAETEPSQTEPSSRVDVSASSIQDPRKQLDMVAQTTGVPLDVLTQQARLQMSNMGNEMGLTVNRPIEFFGKVVSEDDEPIAGAKVHFGCIVYPNGHVGTNVFTDAQGMFSLGSITGAILNVQVSKIGYTSEGTNQTSFTYYSPTGTIGFNSDPRNPVVFKLRRSQ